MTFMFLKKRKYKFKVFLITFASFFIIAIKWNTDLSQLRMQERNVLLSAKHDLWLQSRHGANCFNKKEQRNFVYLKTHKTGSETLSAIFRRFGYVRNLSFVLPVRKNLLLGWPLQLHPKWYRPKKTEQFNVLCEHSVLNFSIFESLMPNDTYYITSVREPFERFISAFNYFHIDKYSLISNASKPMEKFLSNPDYYDHIYKTYCERANVLCFPSVVRNAMAFDLGFKTGYPMGTEDWTYNSQATDKWLHELDRKINFVLVTNYIDESLVLLRRKMCWSTKDIIYQSRNIRPHKYRNHSLSRDYANIYRQWNAVDERLYEHFLAKLKMEMSLEGDSFWREVAYFKSVQTDMLNFCSKSNGLTNATLRIAAFEEMEDQSFEITVADCSRFSSKLSQEILSFYDNQLPIEIAKKEAK